MEKIPLESLDDGAHEGIIEKGEASRGQSEIEKNKKYFPGHPKNCDGRECRVFVRRLRGDWYHYAAEKRPKKLIFRVKGGLLNPHPRLGWLKGIERHAYD